MSIQLLTQLAQAGDFAKFEKVFPTVLPCTDAEARMLINAVVTANPQEKTAIVTEVLKLNQAVPVPYSYPPDVLYVYRGCVRPPDVVKVEGFTASKCSANTILKAVGFTSSKCSTSIVEHKLHTAASCYVSCSKRPTIAVDFAQSKSFTLQAQGFIYKIEAKGGIDCEKWFHPLPEFHESEKEVVFHKQVPGSAVVAYALVTAPDNFMPL